MTQAQITNLHRTDDYGLTIYRNQTSPRNDDLRMVLYNVRGLNNRYRHSISINLLKNLVNTTEYNLIEYGTFCFS